MVDASHSARSGRQPIYRYENDELGGDVPAELPATYYKVRLYRQSASTSPIWEYAKINGVEAAFEHQADAERWATEALGGLQPDQIEVCPFGAIPGDDAQA